jgi:hypothetical protein
MSSSGTFRRWKNLANGKTVDVTSDFKISSSTLKALKRAGISVSAPLSTKTNQKEEVEDLLKSMGAKRLTPGERRRFQKHLST